MRFIRSERNKLAHEYDPSAGQGVTITVSSSRSHVANHYLMKSGPFEGRDQIEVIKEAIDWIENYFGGIEKEYKERSN